MLDSLPYRGSVAELGCPDVDEGDARCSGCLVDERISDDSPVLLVRPVIELNGENRAGARLVAEDEIDGLLDDSVEVGAPIHGVALDLHEACQVNLREDQVAAPVELDESPQQLALRIREDGLLGVGKSQRCLLGECADNPRDDAERRDAEDG